MGVTAFQKAFQDYVDTLPPKKRTRKFIAECQTVSKSNNLTPETAAKIVEEAEKKSSQKTSRRVIRSIIQPVVEVLKAYDQVVSSLAQADPMPSALVWGALKVIIDGADRFVGLFESIKTQLQLITYQLRSVNACEELYGNSDELQELLFVFYMHLFKFWHNVDKECERCWINHVLRAAAPFATKKLDDIVKDMEKDVGRIEKLADMVEKGEAKADRVLGAEERAAADNERCASQKWRAQQQLDRKVSARGAVLDWIRPVSLQNDFESHEMHKANCLEGTFLWLAKSPDVRTWLDDDSKSPILWVTAFPGVGKTTACSYMIDHVTKTTRNAIAFHFYQYSQQHPPLEVLRCLAAQLFEKVWDTRHEVPDEVYNQIQTNRDDFRNVQKLINIMIETLPSVYFFLDGLDEERANNKRWTDACIVAKILIQATLERPQKAKLWCSSQIYPCIQQLLKPYPNLDLNNQTEEDLQFFFSQAVSELSGIEIDDEEISKMLKELRKKAKGSFLWASLMKDDLIERTNSVSEMKELIDHGLPQDLDGEDGYYARIFNRIDQSQKLLASYVFSIVTYARRPVRISEIRDAIGMIMSKTPNVLDLDKRPWASSLQKIFAPLIQFDIKDSEEGTCQIVHSTVTAFLFKNPNILHDRTFPDQDLAISPYHIANACLLYLSQDRYERILVKRGFRWHTQHGQSIESHSLLKYAAKYWDKHLDEVERTPELFECVRKFVMSTHFQTCVQVQSLFVEGHFSVWRTLDRPDSATYLKRVFPFWFAYDPLHKSLWKGYREFTHLWGDFLASGTCNHKSCHGSCYAGEIDRCFWSALGPNNFLSQLEERYKSFRVESGDLNKARQCYESLSNNGHEMRLLQMESRSEDGTLSFRCEKWSLPDQESPTKISSDLILTSKRAMNWRLYTKGDFEDDMMHVGRAMPVQFSSEGNAMRIGNKIFTAVGNDARFEEVLSLSGVADFPAYIEEFEKRSHIIVVTSRRKIRDPSAGSVNILDHTFSAPAREASNLEELFEAMEKIILADTQPNPKKNADDKMPLEDPEEKDKAEEEMLMGDHEASDIDSDEIEDSSSDDGQDSAVESWSEGSTEPETDEIQEDKAALLFSWNDLERKSDQGSEDTEGDDGGTSTSTVSSGEVPRARHGLLIDGSDDENDVEFDDNDDSGASDEDEDDDDVLQRRFDEDDDDLVAANEMADEHGYEQDDDTYQMREWARALQKRRRRQKKSEPPSTLCAMIRIYDTSGDSCKKRFQFRRPLNVMLYDSPPVIHPTKPLVVWPLSGGEVLFVDYERQSWFTRKLRASASRSRHVFMKCRFSDCGQYLHIAALEACHGKKSVRSQKTRDHSKDDSRKKEKGENLSVHDIHKPILNLRLLVSTYRLSSRKTTRSPPWLIHRIKINLGERPSLSVSRLPLTLTWHRDELYVSLSDNELNVYRVRLFGPAQRQEQSENGQTSVLVPRSVIVLPSTAKTRNVWFFPPSSGDSAARVLIGSESTPIKSTKPDASGVSGQVIGLDRALAPPIGVHLREEDLGGWGESRDLMTIPEDMGVGHLDLKVEMFDKEDDCDLEPYIF